jgi:hypothetical protein
MFSSLRQDSLFYILDKRGKPTLTVARVAAVSNPAPKYSPNANPLLNGMETTVDITVSVDGQNTDFKKVPSNLSIYGENGIVISDSRDAMNAEIEAMRENSRKIIDSVDYNKTVVEQCGVMLEQLNPSMAQDRERENRLSGLEERMGSMEAVLAEMNKTLKKMAN